MPHLAATLDRLLDHLRLAIEPRTTATGGICVLPAQYWQGGARAEGAVSETDLWLQPELIRPPSEP